MRFAGCLIGLLFFLSLEGKCQLRIGIAGGPDGNFLNKKGYDSPARTMHGEAGRHVDLIVQYYLGTHLRLESGLSVLGKNYSLHQDDSLSGSFLKFRNTFFQVPLQLQYSVIKSKRFEVTIGGGGFVSYWASGKVTGQVPNILNTFSEADDQGNVTVGLLWADIREPYKFDKNVDRRFETGLIASSSVNFLLKENLAAFLGGSYAQSLTDLRRVQSQNKLSRINQTFIFSVGVIYNFKKGK